MFKKDSLRRAAPRLFNDLARETPPRLTSGFSQKETILISEMEESLKILRQAVRQGEIIAGKIEAALAGDNNG